MKILKHLFPVPKEDAHRVITFANENDFISFRHHTYKKEGHKNVELTEVGPRFELKLYQIKLGTVGTHSFSFLFFSFRSAGGCVGLLPT